MTIGSRCRFLVCVSLFLITAGGCAKETPPAPQLGLETPWSLPDDAPRSASAIDPCADRLHELCRPLLMHYAVYRRMPAGIDDLRRLAGPDPSIVFECPVSGRTYVYDQAGLVAPTVQGRIVLYDATPAHDGKRWAVVLEESRPAQPLIPRVVAIPESEFPRRLPAPATQPAAPAD